MMNLIFKNILFAIILTSSLVYVGCNDNPADSSIPSDKLSLIEELPKNSSYTITSAGDVIYIGCDLKLYSSSDNGTTWTVIGKNLPDRTAINEFNGIDNYLTAASNGYGVYLSSDFGKSWYKPGNKGLKVLYTGYVNSVVMTAGHIFMASGKDVYGSSNYGENWISVNNGLPVVTDSLLQPYYSINFLAKGNNLIFAFPKFNGVYYSKDNGDTWKPMNEGFALSQWEPTIWGSADFAVSNTYYFAIKDGNLYRRTFAELSSWTTLSISPISQFVVASENIVATYKNSNVEISTDNRDT